MGVVGTPPRPARRQRLWSLCRAAAWALSLLALAAHGAVVAPANTSAALKEEMQVDDATLLIGFAGPLSGPNMGVGRSMRNGAQLAIDEANRRGLRIAGKVYRLKLLSQDDRADPVTAEYVARYLASQHVLAVVGHWTSGTSLVAAPVYHAAGVIQVTPSAMSRKLTALSYPRIFRTIPNNESMGRWSAQYAVGKLGVRTVVTIDDRTPFGQGLAEQFAQEVQAQGAQVVGRYSVSDKTSDFNAPLLQARKQAPDLIFFGGLDWQAAVLVKSIRRLKLEARFMAAAGTVGLPFLMGAGADANGALVLEPGPPEDKMPGWKSFRQRYSESFDSSIDLYSVFSYEAAQAIIEGLRRAGSTDSDAVARAMHRLRFEGVSGPVAFNEEGDLLNPGFTMYEVKDQRWVAVTRLHGLPR
ncbi:ABC-type branched-chain amino acid transport system, periplasmic component protein [Herbaspirillum rubrisubalbicans M1]|nr:ABC-type branched-chain amino acid transport system, periplasmic component protein [Herbaspirillum rubrisubalbicans M1]